jgi:uncharacterized membrane protein YfcA
VIGYAYLFFLVFFFVLGLVHGFEETEIDGKKARASPVFPVLLLIVPLVFMLGFIIPGIGGMVATALEPTATTIRITQNNTSTAVVLSSKPNSGEVLTPLLGWLYWAYVLVAAFFPIGGYYAGYNLATWLDERQTFPLLIRYPLIRFEGDGKERKLVIYKSVEVPLPEEKVIVVGERPKKKKTVEDYVVLGAERWG